MPYLKQNSMSMDVRVPLEAYLVLEKYKRKLNANPIFTRVTIHSLVVKAISNFACALKEELRDGRHNHTR